MPKETLNIIIATDLHYLSKRINDGGDAFEKLLSRGDGKVMAFIEEIVDAFFGEVKKRRPDALLLLGDLTFNGEKVSHLELAAKLKEIADLNIRICLIPGNHDLNRQNSFGFCEDKVYKVEDVSPGEFREVYADCGYSNCEYFDKNSGSYIVKLSEKLYILMLDTNSYKENALSSPSLIWLDGVLKNIYEKGGAVLAVSHQNVLEHNFMFTEGFMIKNANDIQEIYNKYNVRLNLSGHMHIQHIEEKGIVEIVTSSLAVSPNHFANIVYDGETFCYTTECLKVPAVKDFANISKQEFEGVGLRQLSKLFKTHDFEEASEEEIKKMGDAFLKMNEMYFAGEIFDISGFEEGMKLWENQHESYTSVYIKSILDSVFKEQNYYKVC